MENANRLDFGPESSAQTRKINLYEKKVPCRGLGYSNPTLYIKGMNLTAYCD